MASSNYVAERRARETARLLDAVGRLAGAFDAPVEQPASVKDAEVQRTNIIAYAGDVVEAVLRQREAEPPAQAVDMGDAREPVEQPERPAKNTRARSHDPR